MQPRPLYRWKSFWLGVLVLCFLGWAWNDSYKGASLAQVAWPGTVLTFLNNDGDLRLISDVWPLRNVRVNVGRLPNAAAAWLWDSHPRWIDWWHSIVVTVATVIWTTFLAWRWRRMRRASVEGLG